MHKKAKCWLYILALMIITPLAVPFFVHSHTVFAQSGGSASWVNNGVLQFNGALYKEDKIDNNWHFYRIDDTDGCTDEIDDIFYDPGGSPNPLSGVDATKSPPADTSAKFTQKTRTGSGGCESKDAVNISLTNPENALISFVSIDPNTIGVPGSSRTFTADSGTGLNTFVMSGDNDCQDRLVFNGGTATLIISEPVAFSGLKDNYEGYSFRGQIQRDKVEKGASGDCLVSKPISGLKVAATGSAGAAGGAGTLNGTASDVSSDSCESASGILGWIMCPIVRLLDGVINFLDTQIQNLLTVPDPNNDDRLHATWAQFRNIALIVLVPIMLVMIISTALGYEFFDAYTVKRALPRFVIAIIFITLSWEICTFLIAFFNDIGQGVLGLMTNLFHGADSLADVISTGGSATASIVLFAGLMGVSLTGGLTAGIIFSYAIATVVALLIGFIVLVMRQLVILALILFAPLAILAWIFPGNDKLWKFWWGTFSKLLIMFPMIMALIAAGRIFAAVVPFQGPLGTLVKITAYIAPFFFIPATFKFAGGVFATLSGMVNDRGRGFFDTQRKKRAEKAAPGKERYNRRVLQRRADISRSFDSKASGAGKIRGFAYRTASRGVGGYNIESAASARQAAVGKEINDQIATGVDADIRGASVNLKAIQRLGWEDAKARGLVDDEGGVRRYKSLGGAWVDEANVLAGHKRWGNDTFAQQAILSYEMRKAMKDEDVQGVSDRYASLATEQWGMNERQAQGAWIGSAFENQHQHLEYKHTGWKPGELAAGESGKLKEDKFVDEAFERRGSYPLAQMSAHTIEQLGNAWDHGDEDTKRKVRQIAEGFVYRGGGQQGEIREGENVIPITDRMPGRQPQEPIVSAPGAAHVQEAAEALFNKVNGRPAASPPQTPQAPPEQGGPSQPGG